MHSAPPGARPPPLLPSFTEAWPAAAPPWWPAAAPLRHFSAEPPFCCCCCSCFALKAAAARADRRTSQAALVCTGEAAEHRGYGAPGASSSGAPFARSASLSALMRSAARFRASTLRSYPAPARPAGRRRETSERRRRTLRSTAACAPREQFKQRIFRRAWESGPECVGGTGLESPQEQCAESELHRLPATCARVGRHSFNDIMLFARLLAPIPAQTLMKENKVRRELSPTTAASLRSDPLASAAQKLFPRTRRVDGRGSLRRSRVTWAFVESSMFSFFCLDGAVPHVSDKCCGTTPAYCGLVITTSRREKAHQTVVLHCSPLPRLSGSFPSFPPLREPARQAASSRGDRSCPPNNRA